MNFNIRIRLHEGKQKIHQAACHDVSIEEHMPFLHSEDEYAKAEEKCFSCWCCIPVFLAFVSVVTILPSSFYTGFDLS